MNFTKMHGCGNDYIYVNLFEERVEDPKNTAIKVSDRHFGIGADGLVLIGPSEIAEFRMRIFNADGSEAEMCGNATRCVAKYVYEHRLTNKTVITLETGAGIKELVLTVRDGIVELVRVDMGEPILEAKEIPVVADKSPVVDEPLLVDGKEWRMTCVSMGNPHAVVFTEDVYALDLEKIGPKFENHPRFPKRTNTEFCHVISRTEVDMRVWERGSGETWACGTGACGLVMACILNGFTEDTVLVHLRGGDLSITYDRETNHVFKTGPATEVFSGSIEI